MDFRKFFDKKVVFFFFMACNAWTFQKDTFSDQDPLQKYLSKRNLFGDTSEAMTLSQKVRATEVVSENQEQSLRKTQNESGKEVAKRLKKFGASSVLLDRQGKVYSVEFNSYISVEYKNRLFVFPNDLKNIPKYVNVITDDALRIIYSLKDLKYLALGGQPITDTHVAKIAELKNIGYLNLVKTKITDKGIKALQKCKKLEYLILNDTKITDQSCQYIATLPLLHDLSINRTTISDTGLKHLGKLSGLRMLYVSNTKIKSLHSLKELENLWFLGIDHTSVTDSELKNLLNMKKLERISLRGTKVTAKGIKLLKTIPSVQFVNFDE